MCGRIAVTLPTDAMAQLFAATPDNNLPHVPNFNVCPTNQVHVVIGGETGRQFVSMRWGLLPEWYKTPTDGPLLINARAETIAEKPAFRAAFRERRCLIPASGFYEWTKANDGVRLPWYIYQADGSQIALAGIWQDWGGGEDQMHTCAVVTTRANVQLSAIHHRMPVIVERENWALWMGESGKGAARLMQALPDGRLRYHRVGRAVNSNKASGPELIEPWEPEE